MRNTTGNYKKASKGSATLDGSPAAWTLGAASLPLPVGRGRSRVPLSQINDAALSFPALGLWGLFDLTRGQASVSMDFSRGYMEIDAEAEEADRLIRSL